MPQPVPFPFILEELEDLHPVTNPMFGCLAVYIGEKIVLVMRNRPTAPEDNGIWIATSKEHHASLQGIFPSMRSIGVLGNDVTGWQLLPYASDDFEESVLLACKLIRKGDPRIGKIPKPKKKKQKKSKE